MMSRNFDQLAAGLGSFIHAFVYLFCYIVVFLYCFFWYIVFCYIVLLVILFYVELFCFCFQASFCMLIRIIRIKKNFCSQHSFLQIYSFIGVDFFGGGGPPRV